jgi:hypothetical protein
MTTENYSAWCQQIFASLAEGGVWGVPRSGLVFQKQGEKLVLVQRLPLEIAEPSMVGADRESLLKFQDDDFEVIRDHFAVAGITVERRDLTAK